MLSTDAYADMAALVLRLGLGGMMLLHGFGKLMDLLHGKTAFFDNFDPFRIGGTAMLTMAVIAEFGCSILLILGVLTRLSVIPLIATLSMAFFVFHANDGLMDKELPLIYLIGFVGLFLLGPGKYSVDHHYFIQNSTKYDLGD